jgi:dTDP-4-dehydrorhamnose reductase
MWLIQEMAKKREVAVVNEQYSTPTLADVLAMVALKVAEKEINGMYHISSSR